MNRQELFKQLQLDSDEPIDCVIHQLITDYGFDNINRQNNLDQFSIKYKNNIYYLIQSSQTDTINLYFFENHKLKHKKQYSIFDEYSNISNSISNQIKSKENKLQIN